METCSTQDVQEGMVKTMLLGTLLAKGIVDFTFGGAFLWYLVKYIIFALAGFGAILLGIKLRKKKNAKVAAIKEVESEELK